MNNPYIIVKDNFFDNPNEIRKTALSIKYEVPRFIDHKIFGSEGITFLDNWRGFRHWLEYSTNNLNHTKIFDFICNNYSLDGKKYTLKLCYHYYTEETKLTCFPSFEEYKFHRDSDTCVYAGLIYLYPNPPEKSGTTIIDEISKKKIDLENVYNRLICYSSNLLHGPTDLFGTDLNNGRLTLIFFLEKKNTTYPNTFVF